MVDNNEREGEREGGSKGEEESFPIKASQRSDVLLEEAEELLQRCQCGSVT